MKKFKALSDEFVLSVGLLLTSFFIFQAAILPTMIPQGDLAAATLRSTKDTFKIERSRINPDAYVFDYKFDTRTISPQKGENFFDLPIIPFDRENVSIDINEAFAVTDAWDYPVRENAFMKLSRGGEKRGGGERSDEDPDVLGLVNCRENESVTGYFKAYFEDVALGNGEGYADVTYGPDRREEVCQVLQDIAELIRLDETDVTPDILFAANPGGIPPGALAGASSYFGYYASGPDNGSLHKHIISRVDPTSTPGEFDAFVITNFYGINWDVDSDLNPTTYDFYTVIYHEIMHALGFRGLLPAVIISTGDLHTYDTFDNFSYKDSTLANPFIDAVDESLQVPNGTPSPWFITDEVVYRGVKNVVNATPDDTRPVYSPESWQQGSSLSHFDMDRAPGEIYVMHPSIDTNTERDIHEHEKEVLCHLGYQVEGIVGCTQVTPVAQDDFVMLDGVNPVCISLLSNDINPGGSINALNINLITETDTQPGDTIEYYSDLDCVSSSNLDDARSFLFTPTLDPSQRIMHYTNRRDSRISLPAKIITMPSCESVTDPNEYICNGKFDLAVAHPGYQFSQLWCASWEELAPSGDYVSNACQFVNSPDVIHSDSTSFFTEYTSPAPINTDFPFLRSAYGTEVPMMKLRELLVPGEEYVISFDSARSANINQVNIKFALIMDAPMNLVNGPVNLPAQNQLVFDNFVELDPWTWTHFEQNFIAEDEYESVVFFCPGEIVPDSGPSWVLFDNISIRPVDNNPVPQGIVSGIVYQDLNENGYQDNQTEPGLPGIQVGLFQTGNNIPVQTAITLDVPDAGEYIFPNIPDSGYHVALIGENSYGLITEPTMNSSLPGYFYARPVTVTDGQAVVDQDFGLVFNTPSDIPTDVRLRKSSMDSHVSLFDRNVTFRVSIRNQGSAVANNITIYDPIPPGTQFYSYVAVPPDTYDSATGIIQIPSLQPGELRSVDIVLHLPLNFCGTITNVATLSGMSQDDTDPTNNVGTTWMRPTCLFAPQVK
jgi:uncharacterized repeat protein (TIGR01451 family)